MKNKENRSITYKERASFYDVEYDDRNDKAMLKHYVSQARSALEIPCGSGRNVDLYYYTNVKATLIDIEQEMINIVKEKITGHKNISCKVGDLLDLHLTEKFDLILLPKESIQLFVDISETKLILSTLGNLLNKSGIILIDIFNFHIKHFCDNPPVYFNFDVPENSFFLNLSKGNIRRWSKFAFNNDVLEVVYKYEVKDKSVHIMTSNIFLKNYSYFEFCNVCKDCGLIIEKVYGNYNFTPYTPECNRMIFILRSN